MGLYKVTFIDNKAHTAEPMSREVLEGMKEFEFRDNKTIVNFYIVEADDKTEAIEVADLIIKKIWGDILGIRYRS
jgi:hypothetical protein